MIRTNFFSVQDLPVDKFEKADSSPLSAEGNWFENNIVSLKPFASTSSGDSNDSTDSSDSSGSNSSVSSLDSFLGGLRRTKLSLSRLFNKIIRKFPKNRS